MKMASKTLLFVILPLVLLTGCPDKKNNNGSGQFCDPRTGICTNINPNNPFDPYNSYNSANTVVLAGTSVIDTGKHGVWRSYLRDVGFCIRIFGNTSCGATDNQPPVVEAIISDYQLSGFDASSPGSLTLYTLAGEIPYYRVSYLSINDNSAFEAQSLGPMGSRSLPRS